MERRTHLKRPPGTKFYRGFRYNSESSRIKVYVYKKGPSSWIYRLLDSNHLIREEVADQGIYNPTKEYIIGCLQEAQWQNHK